MPMIRVNRLVKRFGPLTALRELDLEVNSGEFVALLGPNGAGKTTLLRVLATLSRPSSGSVEVASCQLPQQAAQLRRKLGLVSHQPLLYGDLTADENLAFYSRLYGLPATRRSEVLELVGLVSRKHDLVRTFSRGMQQRLAIGRAILHDPAILLLDEPHTGLDQEAGEILDRVLGEVAREGRTILMTSHDLVRAAELATRLVVLSRGRISASLTSDQFRTGDLVALYKQALAGEKGAA
jgi:heme exporter protein A